MKYLVGTITNYILKETYKCNDVIRFVLPSYSSKALLKVGLNLEEAFSRMPNKRIRFIYGIAYNLCQEWAISSNKEIKADFECIRAKGWYNEDNNMTSLRNEIKGSNEDCLVTLLAGYNHINDQAGLLDFYHLDEKTIWATCLRKSFRGWIEEKLKNVTNPDDCQEYYQKISDMFEILYDNGLSDLCNISSFLEEKTFSGVMDGNDAYTYVLQNLNQFNLPCMIGLAGKNVKKKPSKYIVSSQEFFNYSMFLEASSRKKALQQIEAYKDKKADTEHIDELTLGKFKTIDEILKALREYIELRSEKSRETLKTVDFIYIFDRVLGYKEKSPRETIRPKKLYGLAPEVFIRALWLIFGEFKKDNKIKASITTGRLESITITSTLFKHDFDNNELAMEFLKKIVGGIDDYFEQHIRLELGEVGNKINVRINSFISPNGGNDILEYRKSNTVEPCFEFNIVLKASSEYRPFKRQYLWMLPQNHQCRIMANMYTWVLNKYTEFGDALPAFGIPYVSEIFMSRDINEANRLIQVAMQSEYCEMIDLLNIKDVDEHDKVKHLLKDLSQSYQIFLRDFNKDGFFKALENSFGNISKKYREAYSEYLENNTISVLGPALFKAFYIVDVNEFNNKNWVWNDYLTYGIITPLHPVLLDMIKHQHTFLCESFCIYASRFFEESSDKSFSEKKWDYIVDLAKVQWPVPGTLKDQSLVLSTSVRSFDYIHLIGECDEDASFITSRTLLEYDIDEDDILDSDLFRETRASQLIKRILVDYQKIHKHAEDGISIGVYCGENIQSIIAGIDKYLSLIEKNYNNKLYYLKLTIFSDSIDDSAVMNWINAWKARWEEAEFSQGKQHYKNCRISILYRVVKKDDNFQQFEKLLSSVNLDVMFFTDFIKSEVSDFVPLGANYIISDDYRKFPILEKACCRLVDGGREKQRERVLSNHRFALGSLYAEVMARLRNKQLPVPANQRNAIISKNDFSPWENLISQAHRHSAWVVCIDPAVDEDLLKIVSDEGVNVREIVGFGTGVGAHGKSNYTVSTEQFTMVDIKKRISSQISSRLGPLSSNDSQLIADSLIKEASSIAGLSIVKATGPSEYVRDYIAYSLVRKILIKDDEAFCDELVSLDAYRHWFDDAPNAMRPDLLRLQARIIDGHFEIIAQIIECKLANQSEGYLEKARQQIENGVKHLADYFSPRESDTPIGINDKPDQRYWWVQLQRLIASKGRTKRSEYNDALISLERLSEGYFKITWQAFAFAIWTDLDSDEIRLNTEWTINIEERSMQVYVASVGRCFLKKVCLDSVKTELFRNVLGCTFERRLTNGINKIGKEIQEQEIIKSIEEDKSGKTELGKGVPHVEDTSIVTNNKKSTPKISNIYVKEIPKGILLGSATAGSRVVYWEFGHNDLPNRHILVFGASGTGKTYTIQALLCELSKYGQNSLIVDYTNGFTNKQLDSVVVEKLNPKQHIVRKEPLPINPFRKQCDMIDDIPLEEDPGITAQRVCGVFEAVYNLGDQQKSALYSAIRKGLISNANNFSLKEMVNRLNNIRNEGGPNANSAASVISKIQPFVDMNPFGKENIGSWEELYTDEASKLHIVQLAGFMKDTARLITEFSLIDLYWYYRTKGDKDNPKVIVLDEIQNLDHRLDSPLGQFLTEGRKFGISLILATQTLSNLEKDAKDRLFQASHKLFFKPADTEVRSFAQILEDAVGGKSDDWVERLSSLKRGECYSLGPALNEATGKLEMNKYFKIRIKALEDRF